MRTSGLIWQKFKAPKLKVSMGEKNKKGKKKHKRKGDSSNQSAGSPGQEGIAKRTAEALPREVLSVLKKITFLGGGPWGEGNRG